VATIPLPQLTITNVPRLTITNIPAAAKQ